MPSGLRCRTLDPSWRQHSVGSNPVCDSSAFCPYQPRTVLILHLILSDEIFTQAMQRKPSSSLGVIPLHSLKRSDKVGCVNNRAEREAGYFLDYPHIYTFLGVGISKASLPVFQPLATKRNDITGLGSS
ncbi:hypothetical protein J6590_007329 [Homalodisca vitripennis]|nr:hypothetical protein J6590_007329 [Homalodisca vitripennis]